MLGLLVTSERSEWADSKTVDIFAFRCSWAEKSSKNCSKMALHPECPIFESILKFSQARGNIDQSFNSSGISSSRQFKCYTSTLKTWKLIFWSQKGVEKLMSSICHLLKCLDFYNTMDFPFLYNSSPQKKLSKIQEPRGNGCTLLIIRLSGNGF